jgi:hypothetical protein
VGGAEEGVWSLLRGVPCSFEGAMGGNVGPRD